MQRVEIYTDGACRGNPGPGGWGALLRYGDVEKELYGSEAETTNNRMEMMAVISALSSLKRSCELHITTDSKYVKQGITEWIHAWKRNGWRNSNKKPVKNADLWQQLDGLVEQHDTHWHWVKGHSGHEENERVDALANKAIDEMLERQ